MQVLQRVFHNANPVAADFVEMAALKPGLVLAFGSVDALRGGSVALEQAFGGAHRVGCSTAGEISQAGVADGTLVVTALQFETTAVEQVSTVLQGMGDSYAAGQRLAAGLTPSGLRAILLFGQGVAINGSALLAGLASVLQAPVPIMGGLAGDGGAFQQTWVLDDAGISNDRVVCVGLYGAQLGFSHGSYGGWSPFGPARKVTRCENNVLYELDGESALGVYKKYLGEHAKGLPASGLLFPFSMLGADHQELGLIRTILGVDEATGSLTLAGEIEPDGYLRLMHASTDSLVEGAKVAAGAANAFGHSNSNSLALLVSCVGRKLVMGGRVEEEVEAVRGIFGPASTLAGFYSNGEISPLSGGVECKLHNQTMTITYLSETP
jgi:hypothetical protein